MASIIFALLFAALAVSDGRSVPENYHERGAVEIDALGEAKINPPSNCELGDYVNHNNINVGIFDEIEFAIHRNGDASSCASFPSSVHIMERELSSFCEEYDMEDYGASPVHKLDKYEVESYLTSVVAQGSVSCGSAEVFLGNEEERPQGLLGYCDQGERTVLQPDTEKLVQMPGGSLPCRFFTREGVRISTLKQLAELANEAKETTKGEESAQLHLYAVPAGRVFMFAPSHVGEVFEIPHVTGAKGESISVEVLSLSPRVFDIHNFFSPEESQGLIDKALAETSETHKIHRSTTGSTTKGSVFNKRTSENAWDTHGKLAQLIKRRCMTVLGFDEYYESHTDGLQILRYNETSAYVPHMDYLSDHSSFAYNYDSATKGGNRFATILLYMSDMEDGDGGETVFAEAWPEGERVEKKDAIRSLRDAGKLQNITAGSWEEDMIGTCRTRFSVRPQASRAVLFYSQHPNGQADKMSNHGGCPVINGTKWAANLWVWNAAREDFDFAPFKEGKDKPQKPETGHKKILASFHNSKNDPRFDGAQLYYGEDAFFGNLGFGESLSVNTYASHVWNVKNPKEETLQSWTITDEEENVHFHV